jgi:hypothetical protein
MMVFARSLMLVLLVTACIPEPLQTQESRPGSKTIGTIAFPQLPGLPDAAPERYKTPMTDSDNNHYVCHPSGLYKLTNTGQIEWELKQQVPVTACWVEPDGHVFTADSDGQLVAWDLGADNVLWVQRLAGSATFVKLIGDGSGGVWGMVEYFQPPPEVRDIPRPTVVVWFGRDHQQRDLGIYPVGSDIYTGSNGTLFVISPTENNQRTIWQAAVQ